MVLFRAVSYFDLANEANLQYVRLAYLSSFVFQVALLLVIRLRVNAAKDETPLKYVEAKKPFEDK